MQGTYSEAILTSLLGNALWDFFIGLIRLMY